MKLLHQSQFFTSYQSDRGRCFYFDFGHKVVKLSFCQLLALRQQVRKIDLDSHFDGTNPHGMEILMLCNREHMFIFNTLETVDLKESVRGTFAMLELNSLVTT
ncbi:hypothetical protein FHG64_11215 [Antarcticibacterium flavum]|uniref:Uncharacterized protein n=1 Tax=Antarcticibacterium flavum TaxID=2058175 RepID=A0A5B7X5L0_9FLAO|nr:MULTISPECIES: hypothetical protein [Antarcticibacterium]MCM4159439.1 hypothetical protein [Antarcticibacterium sp. W02-3]QCY69923.1 hypothetical protein FHG64_11215 [Antarcticibacterium flavum]